MSNEDPSSCLSWWFPKVEAAGLPVPKTLIVRAPDLSPWLERKDGETLDSNREIGDFLDELHVAALRVAKYPIFLRTGLGSGKHHWKSTCFVRDATHLSDHAFALFEWSHMVDMIGLSTKVWVVRELLKTEPAFLSFEGMPVTKERRWFVSNGEVQCKHPYWPAGAVEEGKPDAADWRERLTALNAEGQGEAEELAALSKRVAAVVPGSWSVDWLWTTDHGWVLIDMAEANRSFHWPGCRNSHHAGVK